MARIWSTASDCSQTSKNLPVVAFVLAGWMVVSAVVLSVLSVLTFENYYIVLYIGLLSIMQVYAPVDAQPTWWTALRWIAAIGFIGFVVIMYWRVAEMSVLL